MCIRSIKLSNKSCGALLDQEFSAVSRQSRVLAPQEGMLWLNRYTSRTPTVSSHYGLQHGCGHNLCSQTGNRNPAASKYRTQVCLKNGEYQFMSTPELVKISMKAICGRKLLLMFIQLIASDTDVLQAAWLNKLHISSYHIDSVLTQLQC